MKSTLLWLALLFYSGSAYAQKIAVAMTKVNVAYEGVDNPLSIVVANCNCGKLVVETDNGNIRPDQPCRYILNGVVQGIANIKVSKQENGKITEVGKVKFRIKPLPLPIPNLGYRSEGKINLSFFKAQAGIIAPILNMDIDARMPIVRFRFQMIRNGTLLVLENNTGAAFNDKIKEAIETARINDRILITNIYCQTFGGRVEELESIDLTIN